MPWNSVAPLGSVSVKANRVIIGDNTAYIETTMGNSVVGTNTSTTRDHFWNVGANEDGRHRFIQSVGFTVGGNAADPVIGTGMDGVIYLKSDGLTVARVQGFYRNASGIYQFLPAFLTGTKSNIGSSYVDIIPVPPNCYGEIFMYATTVGSNSQERFRTVTGFFRSTATKTSAWALANSVDDDSSYRNGLKFGNGAEAVGLNIRARSADASSGLDWNYRITYRAL